MRILLRRYRLKIEKRCLLLKVDSARAALADSVLGESTDSLGDDAFGNDASPSRLSRVGEMNNWIATR